MGKKRIKGSKPTLMQREALRKAGMDPEKWFFVKSVMVQEDQGRLNRTSSKTEMLEFVNRETGEVSNIPAAVRRY